MEGLMCSQNSFFSWNVCDMNAIKALWNNEQAGILQEKHFIIVKNQKRRLG